MIRDIKFFKNKNNKLQKFKYHVGDIIIGEYLSIDRDGMHQYKFGGVCLAILKKENVSHILLSQKVSNIKVEFCINTGSPLIYMLKTIGKKKVNSALRSF